MGMNLIRKFQNYYFLVLLFNKIVLYQKVLYLSKALLAAEGKS
jgi:hypothetical protein